MKHTSFLFLCLIIFFSCSDKTSETTIKEKENTDQITLIFKNPVQNGAYYKPNATKPSFYTTQTGDEIEFIDDNLITQRLHIDFEAEIDTVIIHSKREWVEIGLYYKGVDQLKYLFQNGDTILFNYQGHKPVASVENRSEDFAVTNFDLFERDSIATTEFLASTFIEKQPLLDYFGEIANNLEEHKKIRKEKEEVNLKNFTQEFDQKMEMLQSLKAKGLINKKQYQYRVLNQYFQLSEIIAVEKRLNPEIEANETSIYTDAINRVRSELPTSFNLRNDSLFYSNRYTSYFIYSTCAEFSKKADYYEYKSETAGGRITNYPQAYDSVQVASHLSLIEKKKVLYYYVEYIFKDAGYFPIETRWEYLNKFKSEYQDTAMVNHLIDKYNIKFSIGDDLELINVNGESTSLEALIASNQDKVIYIDFWASWCAPCIKEMPYSKEIQTEFDSDQLIYVYLSADRKDLPWEKAMKRHELKTGLHFRIDNAGYTTKMEELNIPALPHYMIYHKGQLVNKDAPRPSDKEKLIAEFNRYLANQ